MEQGRLGERELSRLLDVGRGLVSELDLESVLHQVLDVARELTGARYAALGILTADKQELERFLNVGIDEEARRAIGPLPRGRGILGELIREPRPLRLSDVGEHPRSYGFPSGHPKMHSFLGVPIRIRGEAYGNLYLTDTEHGEFSEADEQSVVVLADWAAIAIDNARSVEADRLRHSLEASEQERKRWARELHDETLQELGALRLLLTGARQAPDRRRVDEAIDRGVEQVGLTIAGLQSLITELRPAALDELGVEPALATLVERVRATAGLEIHLDVELPEGPARLPPAAESVVYRLVQEALNNVVKHAGAERVDVAIGQDGGFVRVTVHDDGSGFRIDDPHAGFGLIGMRERAELAGGVVRIESEPGRGTTVSAELPTGGVPEYPQPASRAG